VAGFVVCASCGTQIKAGRAYCLRCGENLPVEGAPVKVSVWESLQLSQSKLLMLLAVVTVIVVALVIVIWETRPDPVDDIGQPVSSPAAPPRPVPPPAKIVPPTQSPDKTPPSAGERAIEPLTAPGASRTTDSSRYS
jgi:cytoskeletal protein RodZ